MLETLDSGKALVVASLPREQRSRLGQFMTPAPIARFMASLFTRGFSRESRLLDPGAGMGMLSAAFIERWQGGGFNFKSLACDAYEIDSTLYAHLTRTFDKHRALVGFEGNLHRCDFIEEMSPRIAGDLFASPPPSYSHAILNPPYKKIASKSHHRAILRRAGIDVVNLYAGFVALAMRLLLDHGELVAIIPRSFCNGPYFQPFRASLLGGAALNRIHLFAARDRAFGEDGVLQENVIVHLTKSGVQGDVIVSKSNDGDFSDMRLESAHFSEVVNPGDKRRFIHVPTEDGKGVDGSVDSMACSHSLEDLEVSVSTGPVVDFRLRPHIVQLPTENTAALLYPCHMKDGRIVWPRHDSKKPNAIAINEETKRWLYPRATYVVVRRFSSKEESRRVVASVVRAEDFQSEMVGFENHLNVFHRRKGGLPEDVAYGLAAFLNSDHVDALVRRFSGHTQINAADLRSLKYPSLGQLLRLGRWAMRVGFPLSGQIDAELRKVVL